MNNRVFFPQATVDVALADGVMDLVGNTLMTTANKVSYAVEECAHIKSEVTGSACPRGLVGKVKTRAWLLGEGAELLEGSMVLGDNAYEVESGYLASIPEGAQSSPEITLAKALGLR
jgi:hypothetical protein